MQLSEEITLPITRPIARAFRLATLAACICTHGIGSQAAPDVRSRLPAQPGEELTVYLITIATGDEVWAKFGHNAIWIHDALRGTDVAYNWGLFDFDDRDFMARLARGSMRYFMAGVDMRSMLQLYIQENRSIWAQELNLSPAQRAMVRDLAERNALPENRYYIYDYYRDNCSTRPRDLLDRVLNGAIQGKTGRAMTNSSYRSHTLRLLGDDLMPFAGAQLALGHPADFRLNEWQEMFLPLKLREHITKVSVTGSTGTLEPLVVRELQLFKAKRPPDRSVAPNYAFRFLLTGLAISILLIILLSLSLTGLRPTRVLLGVVGTCWSLAAGIGGTGLILAWTATNHYFMSRNENLFQFNPLSLGLAFLFPVAFYVARARRPAIILSLACAAFSVLGFLVQALPAFDQRNGEIIALALPVHVAMAITCWFLFSEKARRPEV